MVTLRPVRPDDADADALKQLAAEYWVLQDSLRTSPKRANRRHREVYTRQLEICKEIVALRPGEHPLCVIEQVSGRLLTGGKDR